MIVLKQDNALQLIRQPDHAAMAAAIARDWRRPQCLPQNMWERFLDAVRRHDDGWTSAEQKPTLDVDGRPYDFKRIPSDQHLTIWRRSVDLAADDDAYVGLLVAHHARFLYTHTTIGNDDNPAAAQGFINELAVRIVRCTEPLELGDADEQTAIDPRNVNIARRLLTSLDWLSLSLVGALAVPQTTEPLAFGDQEARLTIKPTSDGATITPWPFALSPITATCPVRTVPDTRYDKPRSLAELLGGTPVQARSFTLSPG